MDMLPLTGEAAAYNWKYLNEPASPSSLAFWYTTIESSDKNAKEKNAYNVELCSIPFVLSRYDGKLIDTTLKDMTFEDCKAVVREFQAEQQRIAKQLATQESVFYKKYDDVAPEDILQTILDKYKGKAVLIDIWPRGAVPVVQGIRQWHP
jgi:hypothetical protein